MDISINNTSEDNYDNLQNTINVNADNETKCINKYFICETCNYRTNNKYDFNRHNVSQKHINKLSDENNKTNICEHCKKEYVSKKNLKKHELKCKVPENNLERPEITTELIVQILKQNKDLQNILIEQNKQMIEMSKPQSISNNISNNSNNTTNQQFNLQFFLNETCKDAMNITDFVKSLQLTTADFENTGKLGFIEGITRIIVNHMNSVDTTKRPVHCTDAKRETIYIKDDNVWTKEDDKQTKFKKVVNQVANLNLQQLAKWKEENPDFVTLDSQDNINFRNYYMAAIGGKTYEEDDKLFEKIKRNVLKEIIVKKSS
jgi:hypothetical protein